MILVVSHFAFMIRDLSVLKLSGREITFVNRERATLLFKVQEVHTTFRITSETGAYADRIWPVYFCNCYVTLPTKLIYFTVSTRY